MRDVKVNQVNHVSELHHLAFTMTIRQKTTFLYELCQIFEVLLWSQFNGATQAYYLIRKAYFVVPHDVLFLFGYESDRHVPSCSEISNITYTKL